MNEKKMRALCAAEFFGTFLFVFIGLASVAVMVTGMSDISYSRHGSLLGRWNNAGDLPGWKCQRGTYESGSYHCADCLERI